MWLSVLAALCRTTQWGCRLICPSQLIWWSIGSCGCPSAAI